MVPAGLLSAEIFISGLARAVFSLCPYMAFLLCVCIADVSSSSYEDIRAPSL